jgi:hypothetical protein
MYWLHFYMFYLVITNLNMLKYLYYTGKMLKYLRKKNKPVLQGEEDWVLIDGDDTLLV